LIPRRAYHDSQLRTIVKDSTELKPEIFAQNQGLKLDPTLRSAQRELGSLLLKLGHSDEGLEIRRKIVESESTDKAAWISYGRALVYEKRYAEATAAFDHLADLIPDTARWNTDLGYLYRASLALQKAQKAFERALVLDGARVQAIYGLGLCVEDQGDRQAAQELYERAAALDPMFTAAQEALARLSGQKAGWDSENMRAGVQS
jgi:tetratricopeptide (TPR) repeat protein